MNAKPPNMWEVLTVAATGDGVEKTYADFLRGRVRVGDHSFLLSALRSSNIHPSVRTVIEELVQGKLPRYNHRAPADDTDLRNLFRALRVLDLESSGWDKRESAIEEAMTQLDCKRRTIQKALSDYEPLLRAAHPQFLNNIRSAFK